MLSNLQDSQQVHRRNHLRSLDTILGDLETLNLREIESLPRSLADRLRAEGVAVSPGATISELIDLVFRAQEAYLSHLPTPVTRRRSAA